MIPTCELLYYMEEYLEDKEEVKNLTQETLKKQRFNIKKFIEFLEDRGVEELNKKNVKKSLKKYRSYCLKERLNKRTTVKTYLTNIVEFINYEDVQELIQHEPIKIKDLIEVKSEDPETAKKRIEKISLTKQQTHYFLETIRKEGNKRDYAICKIFLDSGIRLKELVNLDKTDVQVDIDENGFFVLPLDPHEVIELNLRAKTTKGETKDRTTFISYNTLVCLNDMINERIRKVKKRKSKKDKEIIQRNKARAEKTKNELIITNKGTRICKRTVQDIIKKYARLTDERLARENIECSICYANSVSVHILRHTALSYYAEILTISEVQTIAGHANSSTTDKYIHVDHEQVKQKIRDNSHLL